MNSEDTYPEMNDVKDGKKDHNSNSLDGGSDRMDASTYNSSDFLNDSLFGPSYALSRSHGK